MKTSTSATFLALSCVGSLVSAPALAANADEASDSASQRSDIIVNGEFLDGLESPKSTAPLVDTPQTVTVINRETLRQQNLLSLRDALSTLPGITFGAGEGGGGYGDSINLRGYSANNDITIDGVRDSAQYSRSDPFNLEQIELYNGANSVFSGAGSVGGTINIVSKTPQPATHTTAQASIGTDNYYRATIDTNARLSDLIGVRLNAMYHRNDVPGRDVERNKRWGVAPSITIGIDSPTSLTVAYLHQRDNNTPQYGVPYFPAAGGPLPGIDDSTYFGISNLDRQKITVDRLTATFNHKVNDTVTVRNLTRWQRVHQPSQTSAPQASGSGEYCLSDGTNQLGNPCAGGHLPGFYYPSGPRGLIRDQTNDLLYNQTDLAIESGTKGGLRNMLVIGASFGQEDYRMETAQLLRNPDGSSVAQPPIALTDPTDTVWTGPVNRIRTGISYGKSRNVAIYAFDTLEIGSAFEITGGMRYENIRNTFRADSYDTPANNLAYTRGVDQVNKDNLFSYRLGLVFHPAQNTSLYASFANSKTPSSNSVRAGCINGRSGVDSCDVAPETARSYEIGAKADLMNGQLHLTAALFRNERSNYKLASNDPVDPTIQVLDGQARVDGVALGISGNITPAWSIFANYTYLDSSIRQSVSDFCLANPGSTDCGNSVAVPDPQRGQALQQTPKHSGSLFTTYRLPFGLQIGYGVTYQGKFALNQSGATPAVQNMSDDYWVQRLYAAYEFDNGLTAQVNVQNLFNERYFTSIRNNGWAMPGEDRSAIFSLLYSF